MRNLSSYARLRDGDPGSAPESVGTVSAPIIVNGERTHERPVATFFSVTGKKYLAWAGTNEHINLLTSVADDVWIDKQTLGERVEGGSGLALAEFNGRLYLAWTGTNNHINLLSSEDGVSWGQKITFGDRSDHGPGLVAHDGKLFASPRRLVGVQRGEAVAHRA